MANKRTSNRRNKKSFSERPRRYFEGFKFQANDWLIVTLFILGIECLFLIGNTNILWLLTHAFSFESLFYSPAISALVVAIFCMVFIYKAITRKRIGKYAIVIAVLLSIIGFLFLFGFTPSGQKCSGLFGVMTDCSEVYKFQIYVLFLNPISLIIESLLAFTATLALLLQNDGKINRQR